MTVSSTEPPARLLRASVVAALLVALSACGGGTDGTDSTERAASPAASDTATTSPAPEATGPEVTPKEGFSDRETDTTGQSGWWLVAPRGTVQVDGGPNDEVAVTLDLVPSPCGPATATVQGQKVRFTEHTEETVSVALDSEGRGEFGIQVSTEPCSPKKESRKLYMMVYNPRAEAATT